MTHEAGTTATGSSAPEYRRVEVPLRRIADAVMVARPRDGGPVLLPSTAATIWQALATWRSPRDLVERLAERFPTAPFDDRKHTVEQVLGQLEEDGLVDRR